MNKQFNCLFYAQFAMAEANKLDPGAFDGYRNATPSFQVLIRNSTGYYYHRKRRCIMITLIVTFAVISVIVSATLLYKFFFHHPMSGTLFHTNYNKTNQTNHNELIPGNLNVASYHCPTFNGIGESDQVTILFGGINEHGAHVNTIELLPKVNCSNLPRSIIVT